MELLELIASDKQIENVYSFNPPLLEKFIYGIQKDVENGL